MFYRVYTPHLHFVMSRQFPTPIANCGLAHPDDSQPSISDKQKRRAVARCLRESMLHVLYTYRIITVTLTLMIVDVKNLKEYSSPEGGVWLKIVTRD